MTRPLILAVALAFAGLALPAAALEAPKDYAGDWTLSGVSEGDETCDVILSADQAIGGWSLAFAADCQDRFTLPEDIAAWTVLPGGAIGFIDPMRHVVLKFEPVPAGGYIARPANGDPISLDRAVETPELTEQQRMTGPWSFTGLGGTPVCAVTLTASADGMSGTVKKTGACHAPWDRADLTAWMRHGDQLVLLSSKGRLIATLGGDSFEGFTGAHGGVFVGLVRDWDAP